MWILICLFFCLWVYAIAVCMCVCEDIFNDSLNSMW